MWRVKMCLRVELITADRVKSDALIDEITEVV